MKSFSQVVLTIILGLALVAGATFIQHFNTRSTKATQRVTAPVSVEKPLRFAVTSVEWDRNDPQYAAEFELGTLGHYDFWFPSTSAPVTLGLKTKKCTCSQVDVSVLDKRQAEELNRHGARADTATLAGAGASLAGLTPAAAAADWSARVLEAPARWERLEENADRSVTVPANTSGRVRLSWQGKIAGPERLGIELWMQQGAGGPTLELLSVPVSFVAPLRVAGPLVAQVPELTVKGQRETVSFLCWSATRTELPLTVKEENADPCFLCTWKPLTQEEQHSIESRQRTHVRCGYRVSVTVCERVSDQQLLDLGPFQRRILLIGGGREVVRVGVSGTVRGEVKVGADGSDRIDLGSFLSARGTNKTVPLLLALGGDVRLETWHPAEALEVKLLPRTAAESGRTWDLQVHAPPRKLIGPLPPDSAIILEIRGESTRRLRVPIVGQATQ